MACILARGFEHGNVYDFDYVAASNAFPVSAGAKRPGGFSNYGAYSNPIAGPGRMILPVAVSEFYLQFALCFRNKFTGVAVLKWKKGSTVLGSLYYYPTTSVWRLYTGDTANLVATGSMAIADIVWYVIELYIKINDSGTLTLRINGVQDCTFSGDTKPGADVNIDTLEFGSGIDNTYYYLDDVVVNDTTGSAPGNTWPSGANVSGIVPTAAGATTQWTPSAGDNYACVDEIPPVATDFVSVDAVDQIDSYVMGDLPAAAAVVLGVEEAIFCRRVGLTTPTTIKPLVRHGGVDYPVATGIAVPLLSIIPLRTCWAQNPGTGPADWTVANVNALEVGFKSAA